MNETAYRGQRRVMWIRVCLIAAATALLAVLASFGSSLTPLAQAAPAD